MRSTSLTFSLVALVGCSGGTNYRGKGATADSGSSDAIAPVPCESRLVDTEAAAMNAGAPQKHRPTAACCPAQRGPAPSGQPYDSCSGAVGTTCPANHATTCTSDSECTARANGRCFPFEGLVGPGGCDYDQCFTDSNCGTRTPCLCRSSATDSNSNVCDVGGNCAVDSDCGPAGYCSPSVELPDANICWGPKRYYCHTASDQCTNDADCSPPDAGPPSPSSPGYACAYNPQDSRWECVKASCLLP